MKPLVFFDGALLRATLFNPGQSRLFVSFRQRVGDPGTFDDPTPVRSFVNAGFTHLHLQSRRNDWFINDETELLEGEMAAFSGRFDTACAIGFSMGGYGALRFARALRLKTLIAVSPQYSIAPDHVPFDRRYSAEAKGWNAALGDLSARGSEVRGAILADPFRPLDLGNAQMIQMVFPRLHLARLACGGHPATRVIRQGGQLGWLKDELAAELPDPRQIARVHRAARRGSESYWRHLHAAATQRHRPALAAAAQARLQALGAQTGDAGLDADAPGP